MLPQFKEEYIVSSNSLIFNFIFVNVFEMLLYIYYFSTFKKLQQILFFF